MVVLKNESQVVVTVVDGAVPAVAESEHPREMLRGALRDLATLSGELTETEARLEAEHIAQAAKLLKTSETEGWGIEERARKQRAAVSAENEQKIAQAGKDKAAAEVEAKRVRERGLEDAKRQFDEQMREVKRAVQEGEWLADSLLEGAEDAAKKQGKDAKREAEKFAGDLEERRGKSMVTLETYGQQHLIAEVSPPAAAVVDEDVDERHARDQYAKAMAAVDEQQGKLDHIELAKSFSGLTPYALGVLVTVVCAGLGQAAAMSMTPDPLKIGIGTGVGFIIACVGGVMLKAAANRRVRATYVPLRQKLEDAQVWADAVTRLTVERIESDLKAARLKRDEEVRSVRDRHAPHMAKVEGAYKAEAGAIEAKYKAKVAQIGVAHQAALAEAEALLGRRVEELDTKYARDSAATKASAEKMQAEAKKAYEDGKAALQARWEAGLERIAKATKIGTSVEGTGALDWGRVDWKGWKGAKAFPPAVRFGELEVDMGVLTGNEEAKEEVKGETPPAAAVPPAAAEGEEAEVVEVAPVKESRWKFDGVLAERFKVPAMLAYGVGASSQAASLMIDFDRSSREGALGLLRGTTARLLAVMPPGRVRLTMVDPVGLGQTFAGFMHLADYDEQLTGPRIWTDQEAIDKRLSDLTDHMETVIQKYLRNEFETIDAYNAQAGELAEPYRFLVVADFPTGWSSEALRKLTSVLSAGAKCGVHVLVARDTRVSMERRVLEDVRAGTTVVSMGLAKKDEPRRPPLHGGTEKAEENSGPRWVDEVFGKFKLVVDGEPGDEALTELCKAVGEGARAANRVEVDFRATLPSKSERWTGSTASEFKVPVGRCGATRLQYMKLGKGVSQHSLIAGKTGSGKSTLLHVMVTAAAQWFAPSEVEFYLIDFKKGVEFKAYVDGKLPHVKAVAIESDREFGLSVLQRLDAELSRRGEIYRKLGVQDLAGYRQEVVRMRGSEAMRVEDQMPRVLLLVDEFQEFFSEDDKIAQESASLIDRLVRQGRAFGMHVMLGSQTIGGSSGLARATLGQMAVRVALQCSEADSTMILGESNTAARLLTRPGEAIYNDNGGLPEANSPFQVAWLPDEKRDALLAEVAEEGARRGWTYDAVVFEGNKAADFETHREVGAMLKKRAVPSSPTAILGEPVAIKSATRAMFRRQPGSNMLLIGQHEEAAMATLQAAVLTLGASGGRFVVLEGTMAESPLRGALDLLKGKVNMDHVDYREAEEAIARVHEELTKRLEDPEAQTDSLFVVIYALQRYRAIRKSGDDFSFSMSDEPKKLSTDKMLAEIAKEGPAVGIHVIAWADTLVSVERVFDRGMMREFDHRVLFQMSATDSSALIDSPAANRLGNFRALLFSEEQGVMEKFRPFGVMDSSVVERL